MRIKKVVFWRKQYAESFGEAETRVSSRRFEKTNKEQHDSVITPYKLAEKDRQNRINIVKVEV